MGKTLVEKILSEKLGKPVTAGEEHLFSPDVITAYDYPGYIDVYERQMEEFGITSVPNPEKYVLFIDHFFPAGTPKERAIHEKTRRFAEKFGFRLVEGKGIGHQVITEIGYVVPGRFIVHFDGHISTIGALGAFGLGVRNSMIEVFATQQISLMVPDTVRIDFIGSLQPGVTARDVFHTIVKQIGPSGARACVIEYGGAGLGTLDLDERMTLCNLAMFLGGISAIMEPDEQVYNFLRDRGIQDFVELHPDKDANYKNRHTVDLSKVEPIIVVPPSPANTVHISEVVGTPIQVGYIGSCASGRVKDFTQAVEILRGRQVAEGFQLFAVPTSLEIQAKITEMGLTHELIRAGALVTFPSCDYCYGQLGTLVDGEHAITTGTLNIPGRMGSNKAKIFTGSPYTIAATAVHGKITDPRTML